MDSGLPKDLPAGVVDMDDSSTSRNIVRNLDAFSQTGVVAHYSNVTDARIAVQEGKITEAQVDVSVRRLLELIAKADEKPPVLLTAALFIPIRGGFSVSTMNLSKVYFSQDQRMNHAAINPAFS